MDVPAALAAIGLIVVAVLVGGIAVRLALLVASPAAAGSLAVVAGSVLTVSFLAARSRPRLRTPYWG